ncbi:sigma-54 interaction domain-containing protein [Halothiobacillus sp. DCM-1]|uniref:sigma-54 interaction domain-containing protein n=1 Tax=Halothiobacillus sp. DCM-1 TaxID=3112558 RepID=UPI00324C139E
MSESPPSIWLQAAPAVVERLTPALQMLGVTTVSAPAPGVIAQFCDAPPSAPLPGLPWVALGLADEAIRASVAPFASLPLPCPLPALQSVVGRLLARARAEALVAAGRGLVGQSVSISALRAQIAQVAPTEATVLILGESGTGKEVIARMIHHLSGRKDAPFVPINCGAIPAELLESELFGHEKGAFTGALTAKPGRFELAAGGTLFLDEIGDMPLPMQVKILRVLQERSFERVGGRQTLEADVRIIAATHRDLERAITAGTFREDLFYRLNVFPLETLPLRQIAEDIPLIVRALVQRFTLAGRPMAQFSDEALAALAALPWPGNVRELANLVERMGILYPDQPVGVAELPEKLRAGLPAEWVPPPTVRPEDAEEVSKEPEALVADMDPRAIFAAGHTPSDPPVGSGGCLPTDLESLAACQITLPETGFDLKAQLEAIEQGWITAALAASEGVVAQAARQLGIRRTTLVEKMRKFQMMD